MEDLFEILFELFLELFVDMTELVLPQATKKQQKCMRIFCVIYVLLITASIVVGIALLVETNSKTLGIVLTVGGTVLFVTQMVLSIIAIVKKNKRARGQSLYNDSINSDVNVQNEKQ